jgi:hypothetical protein
MFLMSGFVFSQAVPPKAVSDAFLKMFPDAKEIEWEQEEADVWDADFNQAGVEKAATFNTNGDWLLTETAICRTELPAEVFKTLALVFDGFEIEELDKIDMKDKTGYEIDLEKGETAVEIMAAPDGTFTLEAIEVEEHDCESKCCMHMQQKGCKSACVMEGDDEDEDEEGDFDKEDEEDDD